MIPNFFHIIQFLVQFHFIHLPCQQCSSICFKENLKWLIFERKQPVSSSNALLVLQTSPIFVNAEIAYLNLNESTGLHSGFAYFEIKIFAEIKVFIFVQTSYEAQEN